MPLPGRITDIALCVADIDRAIAFYRDKLLLELKRHDKGFAEFWTEGVILALWETGDLRAALDLPIERRVGPHAMVAIRLDSGEAVDAAYADLMARGVEFRKPPQTFPWGARAVYFTDPDDNLCEIYCWVRAPRTL